VEQDLVKVKDKLLRLTHLARLTSLLQVGGLVLGGGGRGVPLLCIPYRKPASSEPLGPLLHHRHLLLHHHPPSSYYSCPAPPSALDCLGTRDAMQEAENDGDEGEDEKDWVSGPAARGLLESAGDTGKPVVEQAASVDVEVPRVAAAGDGGGEKREDSNGQDDLGDSREMGDAAARARPGRDAASKALSLKRKQSFMRAASMRKVNDHLRI
jgi:hypothetical protein